VQSATTILDCVCLFLATVIHKRNSNLRPINAHLSRYYHCTEAPVHAKYHSAMPTTLMDWLGAYQQLPKGRATPAENFHCYSPLNFQTQRAGQVDKLNRYAFVGLTEDQKRSVCVLNFIIAGKLPQMCVCGEVGGGGGRIRRSLKRLEDHGVVHHGGSTTAEERAAMLPLIQQDLLLYESAKLRFAVLVKDVEATTGMVLCR
jgi:hypothetical protein